MPNYKKTSIIEQLYNYQTVDIIYNALPRTLQPGYHFGPHCHENVELCLMYEGQCNIIINGEEIAVRKGEMLVIFSHMIHAFHVKEQGPAKFLQMHFKPSDFLNTDEKVIQSLKFISYMSDHRNAYLLQPFTARLFSCVERIVEEVNDHEEAFHAALANIYVDEMIFLLSREIQQSFRRVFRLENPTVIQAIQYISEHLGQRISIEDVAKHCGVTGRYLSGLFKKCINITINDYINIAKIDMAIGYFSNTDMSLIDIASKLGFSSPQYFSTVFKKFTGVTPREYKIRKNRDI